MLLIVDTFLTFRYHSFMISITIDLIPYKERTMHNTYRLAGHTVKIESLYPQVHTLCADYRTDDPPEYVIATTEADIAFERAKSARENIQEGAPVQEYESRETGCSYKNLHVLHSCFLYGGKFRLSVCESINPLLMQPFTDLHSPTTHPNFTSNPNNALFALHKILHRLA